MFLKLPLWHSQSVMPQLLYIIYTSRYTWNTWYNINFHYRKGQETTYMHYLSCSYISMPFHFIGRIIHDLPNDSII